MECIIIAIPKRDIADKIADLIRRRGQEIEIHICNSASSVLNKANETEKGVLICSENVRDMNYSEIFDYLPPEFEMIILSRNVSIELLSDRMKLLAMPFRAVNLLEVLMERLGRVRKQDKQKKKVHIERTPEEQKMIDQAKMLLMKKYDVSEPEAYRMLQKQSMDYGRKLEESAQMILLLNSEW